MNKTTIWSSAVALTAITLLGAAAAQRPDEAGLAPVLRIEGKAVPDQYIVVFKKGVARTAAAGMRERVKALGGTILFEYKSALNGFSVKISPEGLRALRADSRIEYIEPDQLNDRSTQSGARPGPNQRTAPAARPSLHLFRERCGRARIHRRHRHPGNQCRVRRAG